MGKEKNTGTAELLTVERKSSSDRVIALSGNPNVGKSTVFNMLTGMKQHTGNWPGKTVATAQGIHNYEDRDYILVDLPGTYSIIAHSGEEEIARDFILFGNVDATIVVCDATCLERNLNLALQVMELTDKVVICVNLMDEARKKEIYIDLNALEQELGVPVIGTSARSGKGLGELIKTIERLCSGDIKTNPRKVRYSDIINDSIIPLKEVLTPIIGEKIDSQWAALRMLEEDTGLLESINNHLNIDLTANREIIILLDEIIASFEMQGISLETVRDMIVESIVLSAEEAAASAFSSCGQRASCAGCMNRGNCIEEFQAKANDRDRRLDRILTSKSTGIPVMLALLCLVFWLTITGANYPSLLLSNGLFWIEDRLSDFFMWMNAPDWLHGMLVLGMYRVMAWVVSVMLPPMAIFFPLFTLLEDFGYLPRVAFNLDYQFKKAKACGKQALTMCMGFGCNAAGVVGCRIIDSPRERLIAIITNNFVPCNGRFPTLIMIISMFFVGAAGGAFDTLLSALILTGVIMLGILLTFGVSRFLSETILKGEPSSFTLELPPYRAPQIGKVIIRSIFDRTLFVLGRAVAVALPAGLIIWILANTSVGGDSLLNHCAGFLDPFARLLGLDGVILLAFILGFPANEIVVPIIIMAYMSSGSLMELDSILELKALLTANGWTWVTAVSTMLFCLIHWPCSTACLTIKKETGSLKWTLVSIAVPTIIGMTVCFLFACAMRLLGF